MVKIVSSSFLNSLAEVDKGGMFSQLSPLAKVEAVEVDRLTEGR
jgi:hypothetical protein